MIGASNFAGKGTAPVGRHAGIGPYGTYDMAGNVREWLWNAVADGRSIAGGAWNQAPYIFLELDVAPPWDRSAGNGIRCMRTQHGLAYATELRGPIERKAIDYAALVPVEDDAYAVLAQQLEYSPAGLDARVEPLRSTNPLWRRERITIATGYDDSRFAVHAVPADRGHAALPASGLRTPCRVHEAAVRVERFRTNRFRTAARFHPQVRPGAGRGRRSTARSNATGRRSTASR